MNILDTIFNAFTHYNAYMYFITSYKNTSTQLVLYPSM